MQVSSPSQLTLVPLLTGIAGVLVSALLVNVNAEDRISVEVMHLNGPVLAVTAPAAQPLTHQMRQALAQRIDVAYAGEDLQVVARSLARRAGINVVVDPRVTAAPVDLQLTNVTTENALRWVAQAAGVEWSVVRGAVYFSSQPVTGPRSTRLYAVADLVSPVVDMPGPTLALQAPGNGGAMLFQAPGEQQEPAMDAEDLAEFLEEQFNR